MKISAVIAEYNPLHRGHAYHMAKTRRQTGCDALIVLMSGNFVQRGEPAVFDKWTRARLALRAGADMVIELPVSYACASAERFAMGAVRILNGLHCTDALSFGSETADLSLLQELADMLAEEPRPIGRLLQTPSPGVSPSLPPAARPCRPHSLIRRFGIFSPLPTPFWVWNI